jgi:hypothetical protein
MGKRNCEFNPCPLKNKTNCEICKKLNAEIDKVEKLLIEKNIK